MPEFDQLIRTKLRPPYTRPSLVSRPRLEKQVAQGLRCPLTLVIAPAGFGKTTLVVSSVTDCGMLVSWLSLDKNDNQPGRFLTYLVSALQEVEKGIGGEAALLVAAPQPAEPEAVLTSLINDLDRCGTDFVLVLDDYQLISNHEVHDQVAFLLEHCPHTLHVVIASRSDPPLPLARLRARGQTVELRAADLRFTEPEAALFLGEVMGLSLDTEWIKALSERTEGWVAGLQMASIALQSHLSMRAPKDVTGFIEKFSGTNRYILDYLLEEVLASQPPEIQRFLLVTSILERLTAPLCDTILDIQGQNESASEPPIPALDSSALLEHIERANLFLVPLDDERIWYRYHNLFADLLRAQLHKSIGDQAIAELHHHASIWFEGNGLILEAIQHASLVFDFERMERLIEQNYVDLVNREEMALARYWMGKLDDEMVYRRPWLCLYEALNRSWFGQIDEANLFMEKAENSIRSEIRSAETQAMLGYLAYIKSRLAALQGDTHRAVEYALEAWEKSPSSNQGLHIEIGITLAYEYFLIGKFVLAREVLDQIIQSSDNISAVNTPVAGYAILARMQRVQGQLHSTYDLYQRAASLIQNVEGRYLGAMGITEVGIAAVLCEWNDLENALAHLKHGLSLLPLWGKPDDLAMAYTTLSRIQLALGNRADAAEAVEKASRLIQSRSVFSEARSAVEASRVSLWLSTEDWLAVDRWIALLEERSDPHDPLRYEEELSHISLARVFISRDKHEDAFQLLLDLAESAGSEGRWGRLIEVLILKALALRGVGKTTQSNLTLTKCLELAQPEGYVRIFLDEGKPMQALLTQWAAQASTSPLRGYAAHLLSQFETQPPAVAAAQEKISSTGGVVEPLSQRELEVLQLMALGRTNQGIAQQLIVALGTVKAHAASIYRKLDVANRTEAVARARQLGLLR